MPFAAARDRLFFAAWRISIRDFRALYFSVVQAGLSTLLLLVVGRFQQLFELAILPNGFFTCSRRVRFLYIASAAGCARPYRVWGYPVLPAVFIRAAAVLLYYLYAAEPAPVPLLGHRWSFSMRE